MFTRCIAEPQGYEGQVQDILDESFDSEFQASQECWSIDRQVQMIRVNVINDVPESFHSLFVPLPIVDDQINLLGMLAEI